eukprot:2340655-Amphidinium_carterae.1
MIHQYCRTIEASAARVHCGLVASLSAVVSNISDGHLVKTIRDYYSTWKIIECKPQTYRWNPKLGTSNKLTVHPVHKKRNPESRVCNRTMVVQRDRS